MIRIAARTGQAGVCIVALLLAGMLLTTSSQAGVYRWVDANGRVHFGDRPPDGRAQELDLPDSASPDQGTPQPTTDHLRKERRQRLLDLYRDEREQKAKARADKAAQAKAREQRCAAARNRLERYRTSGYLYEPLADGERRVFSNQERRVATERAESEVDRWCK